MDSEGFYLSFAGYGCWIRCVWTPGAEAGFWEDFVWFVNDFKVWSVDFRSVDWGLENELVLARCLAICGKLCGEVGMRLDFAAG